MAEAKKAAAPAPEPAAAAKPKKNILLMVAIILLVVLILVIGGLGFLFIKAINPPDTSAEPPVAEASGHEEEPVKKKPKEKKKDGHGDKPVFVKLDTFTVNLQGGANVLQTEIHVQVSDEKQKELITGYMPRISSQVNLLLSSKKPDELATLEGKQKLMEDIKVAVNRALGVKDEEDGAMSVELKTFIVQ